MPCLKFPMQPVDPREVGRVLAETAEAEPSLAITQFAGPEVVSGVRAGPALAGADRLARAARAPARDPLAALGRTDEPGREARQRDLRQVAGSGMTSLLRLTLACLACSAAVPGLQATLSPRAFYDSFPFGRAWVQMLPPYNEHLTRDVGNYKLAFAILFAWAAWRPSAVTRSELDGPGAMTPVSRRRAWRFPRPPRSPDPVQVHGTISAFTTRCAATSSSASCVCARSYYR